MKHAGPFPVVVSAKADRLYLANGQTLIDAISSWWVITHGHCCPEIMAAIAEQTNTLDQVIFAGFTHPGAERLAAGLVAITPPSLTRVFFSDDGSTSVEVALKMAMQACAQRGEPQRDGFLAFESAYHGDTVGAMSVGGEGIFTQAYKHMMFRIIRASHPSNASASPESYTADFHQKINEYGHRLAGVIVEPLIQGAGGMVMWPEAAVRDIVITCRAQGIPVIFDEVMTGFGRTGSVFAMDRLGLAPDLLCLSKGLTGGSLPLAVTMATESIYAAFLSDDRKRTFFHGHSFTANAISCAAANANLALLQKGDWSRRWREISEIHQSRLSQLRYADALEDRRCLGTVGAVALKTPQDGYLAPVGPKMYAHAFKRGVLLRPLGNVLYVLPPYCMTAATLHQVWDVVEECIALAAKEMGYG